jgi:hypothetical protein
MLEKAGTNERQVAAAMDDMRDAAKTLKTTEDTVVSAVGEKAPQWKTLKDAVDSGEWAKATKAGPLKNIEATVASLDQLATRLKTRIGRLESSALGDEAPALIDLNFRQPSPH